MELLEDRRLMSIDSSPAQFLAISPSLFVENQGQWADASIRFLHQGDGANVALTDAGPVFEVFRQRPIPPLPTNLLDARRGAGGEG